MKCDIFHSSKTIEYGQEFLSRRAADGNIDEKEHSLILQFLDSRIAEQPSFSGAKYVSYLTTILHFRRAGYLKVPWYSAAKDQILSAIALYKNQPIRYFDRSGKMHEKDHPYSSNTLQTDLREVVTWLSWLSQNKQSSMTESEISKIKIPTYTPKRIDKESVYSEPMVSKLVETASPMLKAMVWTHYETGCRSNEICDLRWRDIEWRDKSALIRIRDSKEKQIRSAFVSLHSVSSLIAWRNMYPGNPDGDSYVFLNKYGGNLKYATYSTLLENLQFTHIDGKRVRRMPYFTPHDLRRWRATNLFRQGINRSTVCLQLWGSTKTRYDAAYSQFNEDDMYSEFETSYGIKEKTDTQKPLAPNYCYCCGHLNSGGARFCESCGKPLVPDASRDLDNIKTNIRSSPEYRAEMLSTLNS